MVTLGDILRMYIKVSYEISIKNTIERVNYIKEFIHKLK